MVALAAGAVVLVPFPFSDLSGSKLRPAVVLAFADRDDWILCQVTANPYADNKAIELTEDSFKQGYLQRTSYARPGKLFTGNSELIRVLVGQLETSVMKNLIDSVINILRTDSHPD